MRRSAIIIMLVLLVGCAKNQIPPTNVSNPTTVPTPTVAQPTATSVSSTNSETNISLIANIPNDDLTAIELYTIDVNGQSDLKQSLECPNSYCEQTHLYTIQPQATIALVVGDNGSGGELYQVSYQTWQVSKISDQVAMNSLAITPDGSKIAFLRLRPDTSAPVALGSIWVYDFAEQTLGQVSEWGAFYADLLWLDNRQILFSRAKTGTPPTNWATWLLDLNNPNQPQEISAGRVQAVIGEQLFIEHEQTQMSDLNPLIQIQRYDLQQGLSTPISDWYDRYSQILQITAAPNHQQAAMVAGGEPEMLGMTTSPLIGVDLQLIGGDGTVDQAVYVECIECWPSWSSNSQTMLFFDYTHEHLVLVDAATGAIKQQKIPARFYPHPSHSLYHILMIDN